MLKKDALQRIAALAKIDVATLEAAIKDDKEVDVAIDDKITAYTADEIETLGKNKYDSGKKAGEEMSVDAVKKDLGLTFTGKTVKGLVEAATKKAVDDAKIEPDEKVRQLSTENETLRNSVKEFESKLTAKDSEIETIVTTTEIGKHMPKFGDNSPALNQDEFITLMKANGYEFKREGNVVATYKDGKRIDDKLAQPEKIETVVAAFAKEKKFVSDVPAVPAGGRGHGNNAPAASATKLSDLKAQFVSQGKSLNGDDFRAAVNAAAAANKEFDMSS
jgi:hypothetical protein